MKLTTIYSLIAAAAAGLGLWSCSADNLGVSEPDNGPALGETVRLTVAVSRDPSAATRTVMSETNGGADLACKWTEGDKLLVTDASGVRRGVLEITGGVGEAEGTFTGEVSIEGINKDDAGKTELNFLYLGTSRNAMEDATSVVEGWDDASKTYTAYYASQPGTLLSLTEQDLLSATKKVTLISGDADKSSIYVEKFMMNRRISFAKFKLNMPEGVDINSGAQVTITGTGLKTCAKVSFAAEAATEEGRIVVKYDKSEPKTKGSVSGGSGSDADYDEEGYVSGSASATVVVKPKPGKVILPVGSDGSFYMVLLPNGLTGDDAKFDLNFEVTASNGTVYKGAYNVTKEIVEGKYYRSHTAASGTTPESFGPIEITMSDPNAGTKPEDPQPPVDTEVVGPVFESNGKYFRFTRANIQYNTKTGTWILPEKQTDFVVASGRRYKTGMGNNPDVIGLFRWGATGYEDLDYAPHPADYWKEYSYLTNSRNVIDRGFPSSNSSLNDDLNSNTSLCPGASSQDTPYDWGKAFGKQKGEGHYYTLTSTQLKGVIDGCFTALGTVDEIKGAIIIPNCEDASTARDKIRAVGGSASENQLYKLSSDGETNKARLQWTRITLTYEQLTALNALFFPAGGMNNPAVNTDYGNVGYYWTSTVRTSPDATAWAFDGQDTQSSRQFQVYGRGRGQAFSVRLVKEVTKLNPDDEVIGL